MGGIGGLTNTTDRASSDIRIYCDDDAMDGTGRWQPVPDIPNLLLFQIPNLKKTAGVDKEYIDTINGVRRVLKTLGCKDPQGETQGATLLQTTGIIHGKIQIGQPLRYAKLIYVVSTILYSKLMVDMKLCDMELKGKPHSMDDIKPRKDLGAIGPGNTDLFSSMTSVTLLHEVKNLHQELYERFSDTVQLTHTTTWTSMYLPIEKGSSNNVTDDIQRLTLIKPMTGRLS